MVKELLPMLLAHGADPHLTDSNHSFHPIWFEAAKVLEWKELKPLVRAAINSCKGLKETDDKWPFHWKQAARAQEWEQVRNFILNSKNLVPSNIEEKVRCAALATLAKSILKVWEGQ